jgi:hypothetical protein
MEELAVQKQVDWRYPGQRRGLRLAFRNHITLVPESIPYGRCRIHWSPLTDGTGRPHHALVG